MIIIIKHESHDLFLIVDSAVFQPCTHHTSCTHILPRPQSSFPMSGDTVRVRLSQPGRHSRAVRVRLSQPAGHSRAVLKTHTHVCTVPSGESMVLNEQAHIFISISYSVSIYCNRKFDKTQFIWLYWTRNKRTYSISYILTLQKWRRNCITPARDLKQDIYIYIL